MPDLGFMSRPMMDLEDLPEGIRGPAAYPQGDDGSEETYAVFSRELLDEQREAMEPLFLTWTQNLLFLAGHQWWQYDSLTGTFQPPKVPKWKERPVRNLIRPFFKHFLAKATKNRPQSSCVPASTDPDDIQAADLGDDVIRAKWIELRMNRIIRRTIAWVITTGNAVIMPYWNTRSGILQPLSTIVESVAHDKETGQPVGMELLEVPADENGEPLMDEEGNYALDQEPAYIDIGEVGYKVFSPFQVFVDPGAECDEDVTFVLVAEPMTVREIKRRWPENDNIIGEDVSEVDRFNHMITGMASGADTHMVASETKRDFDIPKGLVIHYFQKPDEQYPFGRHWVTVGRTLLEKPGPLPDGIWPVAVWFRDIDVPGRFHAEATMTAAVGLNREYNEICAAIKEHHNLLLRGKWLVPIGSNIRRGQITTQPGEVIQHTPGLPPQMADLKPLPQKVYEEREKVLADFELITSMHQITMGKPPPGVTSGRAFLTLQEADDSDLGPFLEMLESGVAELGWLTLQIIQQFYEDDRLLRVTGENNRYRVRTFKGADLTSIVDVEPQAGSAFPWSAVAKQSMMIDLAQSIPQLFMDPETGMFDHERFRRLLPVGGNEAVGAGSDIDLSEALREEEQFEMWDGSISENGAPDIPGVMPWQNHQVHLRAHGRLLKSASVQRWEPENQMALVQHWMETQATLMQMMMAQAEAEEEEETPPEGGSTSESGQ